MGEVEVHVLRGVSLKIEEGEFVAVMGPSGAGKSTFMNILGCLDYPTSGNYIFDGQRVAALNINQLAEIRNRKIGFVFQNFNLLPRMAAVENVELPLIYGGVPRRERRNRALEMLRDMGLKGRETHNPSKLSGGEQQRVAIARAIVNQPILILADEPTGNLDSGSAAEVMAIFQRLNSQGITIILVTHEADIAQYARRRLLFRDGKVVEDTAEARVQETSSRSASGG
ncbi:MAG: ABC transporter ATP-binding protein [Planctomycetes bacterium]|nr:ABC transporter ATP-binding protein [Planctomycetota bacterium]